MDNASEVIVQLTQRIEALEDRVLQLESSAEAAPPVANDLRTPPLEVASFAAKTSSSPLAASTFTTLGKAILGMAGAYVLRAFAEAGNLPRPLIVVLAIAYAMAWLGAASRVPAKRLFARFAYALTSALILAPMLWELTLRFRVLPPAVTAASLAIFAIAALGLSWTAADALVFWIACITAGLTALGLMIATQDLPPFLLALLVTAAATAFASFRGRLAKARILTALTLDLATAALLYIYSLDSAARSGYRDLSHAYLIALSSAPFLLDLFSNTIDGSLRRRTLSLFEIAQGTLTLLFAAYAAARFSPAAAQPAAGIVLLCLATLLYAIAFAVNGNLGRVRNVAVFSTWAAVALVLGGILLLPHSWLAGLLTVAAIASTTVGIRSKQPALEYDGALYLLGAAYLSNIAAFDHHALLLPHTDPPGWSPCVLLLGSVLCYGITLRGRPDDLNVRIPHLAFAGLAVVNAVAFLAYAFSSIQSALQLGAAHGTHPLLQTCALCLAGLALAIAGSLLRKRELLWLAYTVVILAAAKILLHDVGHEGLIAIAATFVFYAATLILIPRFTGSVQRSALVPPPGS